MNYLLSHLLEASAEARPEQEAFRCRGEALTYSQLDRRAQSLAGQLQGSGVFPGERVAIHMPKCLEMPVSVYGVLKAGAVYVPVDPGLPIERLEEVLEDAEVSALLTHPRQQKKLSALSSTLSSKLKLVVGSELEGTPSP